MRDDRNILYFVASQQSCRRQWSRKLAALQASRVLAGKNRKSIERKSQIKGLAPQYISEQDRGYSCRSYAPGSLTVEASFCSVIFFFALFSLLYLFQIIAGMQRIQLALADAALQYEAYGTKTGSLSGLLEQSAWIRWQEEEGLCYVEKRYQIPFLGSRFFRVNTWQQMKVSSYDGESMVLEKGEEGNYVYLAENSKVYHKDEFCVYLNPGITSIRYSGIEEERNKSGGRYKACQSCGKGVSFGGNTLVYITPYGDRYHSSRQCPGLKRGVHKVLLSQTGDLPACSKCGR